MNHLENAVLIGAKGLLTHFTRDLTNPGSQWETIDPLTKHDLKELALPIVQALHDAGLLVNEPELRHRIATELETYATTQPGQGFGVYHNAAKTIRNPK